MPIKEYHTYSENKTTKFGEVTTHVFQHGVIFVDFFNYSKWILIEGIGCEVINIFPKFIIYTN